MKLNEDKYPRGGAVPYLLYTENGDAVRSEMRVSIAEEIVARAKKLETQSGDYGLLVEGRMAFPSGMISFEEGEKPKRKPRAARKPAAKKEGPAE